jgi:hypothetical protein
MATDSQSIILWHGTTRRRAEAILKDGPNPDFVEPGSPVPAEGFSTTPPQGFPFREAFPVGDPRKAAASKATQFPNEGGPAILEFEVPMKIAGLAYDEETGGEYRFERGHGLEELLAAWATISKRIV